MLKQAGVEGTTVAVHASDDARSRLLRAGRQVFGRNGYAVASTRDILAIAGVTAPTLYHHFGNKAGLFVAVVDDVGAEIVTAMRTAVGRRVLFLEQMDAVLDAAIAVQASDDSLVDFIASTRVEIHRHPELREARGAGADLVTEFVVKMCRSSADLTVEPDVAAAAVTILLAGLGRVTPGMRPEQVRTVIDSLRVLVRGLVTPACDRSILAPICPTRSGSWVRPATSASSSRGCCGSRPRRPDKSLSK